jgi:DNA mismatch repair ATPase MutS
MDKNIMITGPNASGKTTLIKSTIINIFLSQSIGFGCYKKCKLNMYDYFHSYLNIPDTSNRDSLFQAEARRCKTIFDFIKKNNKKRHLCIFDEIYSGTNPSDAVLCANIYLNGMNQYKSQVDYILTTHYLELCKKYENDSIIKNQKMGVIQSDKDNIEYTYQLKDGISDVHGGFHVLQKLDYPDELLKSKC